MKTIELKFKDGFHCYCATGKSAVILGEKIGVMVVKKGGVEEAGFHEDRSVNVFKKLRDAGLEIRILSDRKPVNTKNDLKQKIQKVADKLRQTPGNSMASAKEYYKGRNRPDQYYPFRVGYLETAIADAADKLEAIQTEGGN
jgi:hypothetical protein